MENYKSKTMNKMMKSKKMNGGMKDTMKDMMKGNKSKKSKGAKRYV